LIYGDSITLQVALDVFERLTAKGFASTNVVFGVGSYTMQYLTRDSLGMAVKATYAEVAGVGYELFKDPITDNGMKKSAKGLLRIEKEGDNFVLYDQQTPEQEQQGELKTVFKDGKLVKEFTFKEIRDRLWNEKG
jgi:nicotinamide phosphoribosyltransferase